MHRFPTLLTKLLSVILFTATAASVVADSQTQAGERVFRNQCRGCHSLEPGVHIAGPSLHDVVGRRAGKVEDFDYSPALQDAQWVWTAEMLDRFLTDPDALIPGTRMVFWGLEERPRRQLIEFLEHVGEE
ncbi:hypothetical protein L861_20690 [Litchfieldella anticariensis FP35 = DSM 16096]|uniref:Cytochrome c domain-containing protein n=1 Tax=Litchfieldella anticariensis (strain DSM 16096 / CECT 5854 / CIP 108499 / LMG 22089 / FP35) TaxID=1121939 RepID=S2L2W9_LITA3|nr:c-type cytochrome [Halomonas anticariensis]EPC02074.1 hypothetical protein L861_20690 [Halomonas anticariensis FP35 = DSM 16096]